MKAYIYLAASEKELNKEKTLSLLLITITKLKKFNLAESYIRILSKQIFCYLFTSTFFKNPFIGNLSPF